MKTHLLLPFVLCLFLFFSSFQSYSQSQVNEDSTKLYKTITKLDSSFFAAYNNCELEKMKSFFTEDLEFYHDKGGLTTTAAKLIENTKTGLCGNENRRLKREVVKGTLKVYPIKDYGAILSGEHLFYIVEKGKGETLDGHAKFTHLWQFKNNEWKMSRVLSYDHKPASFNRLTKAFAIQDKLLDNYAGKYEGTGKRTILLVKKSNLLELQDGDFKAELIPESENSFFLKDRNVHFEFVANDSRIIKMVVRENGQIVEEAKKL